MQKLVRLDPWFGCLLLGARSAQALVDSAMSQLRAIVSERLSGRGGSSGGGRSSGGGGGGRKTVRSGSLQMCVFSR